MRVAIPTLDFDDDSRRAIRASVGKSGKATRAECVDFAENAVEFALQDVADHYLENPADELDDDELPGAELVLDGLESHYLQNPADELEDDDLEAEDDEIEGIPNADFEELEDDLRIVDHWI